MIRALALILRYFGFFPKKVSNAVLLWDDWLALAAWVCAPVSDSLPWTMYDVWK